MLARQVLPAGVGVADEQGLHVVGHHVVVRASNQHDAVVPLVGVLQHRVCLRRIVIGRPVLTSIQVVDVVTQSAGQGVCAWLVAAIQAIAPVEDVVAGVARDEVVEGVASAAQVDIAGQGQVFEIAAERPAHLTLSGVDALVGTLGDRVAGVVHYKGVVACRARHRVGAAGDRVRDDRGSVPHRAAVAELDAFDLPRAGEVPEHPRLRGVAGHHNDQIVAVAAECDVRRQHVAAKQDAVCAAGVDDRVAPRAAADLEGVVVSAAVHRIVAQAAFERVCADAAKQRIRSGSTIDAVVAKASVDRVVATERADGFVPAVTDDSVIALGSQGVEVAGQHIGHVPDRAVGETNLFDLVVARRAVEVLRQHHGARTHRAIGLQRKIVVPQGAAVEPLIDPHR